MSLILGVLMTFLVCYCVCFADLSYAGAVLLLDEADVFLGMAYDYAYINTADM